MGHGMAEFCSGKKVDTLDDYNLYTHYVAGLVGIGLTGLFVQSGMEEQDLGNQEYLANRMGLFLQKTNILKDYLEDLEQGRLFWPKEVWELYVPENGTVSAFAEPKNIHRSLACLNHLCVDALELVPDCLLYLSKLKNPTVFQFAAIPQLMAIASLVHFYNNPALFTKKGNKIRRGLAVKLILSATSMESVKQIYFDFALDLNRKNRAALGRNPFDKNFMRVSSACSNVS
jgi:farnesyl-diphosphate farnesyltransferase